MIKKQFKIIDLDIEKMSIEPALDQSGQLEVSWKKHIGSVEFAREIPLLQSSKS